MATGLPSRTKNITYKNTQLLQEHDPELAVEIRRIKFERFNAQWLDAVKGSHAGVVGDEIYDYDDFDS